LVFSDSSNKLGIIEDIDFLVNTNSTSYPTAQKTRNINEWYNRIVGWILEAQDDWQWDDTNQTDLPIGTISLVASQQDYPEPISLTITRVECKDSAGNWILLKPLDQKDVSVALGEFFETASTPIYYDKLANSIFLYPAPSYASTNGLKVYFLREPDYFTASDDTQEPGFSSIFHRLLSLGAAYDYALAKGLPVMNHLQAQITDLQRGLISFYGKKSRDKRVRFNIIPEDYS